jgi:uncharacterized protein YgiM (DUF1202 family)
MLTIRVIADKVNLRVRPGKEHSPLQQVARGTELVVESRVGDWYQVITPTGSRAYILSDFVQEIRGISGSPSRRSQLPMRTMPQTMPQDIPGMAPFGATPGSAPSSGATADEKQAEEEAEAMRLLKDAMSGR